ncbi:MAG: hypothetical protein ACOCSD_01570 [Halolamina sp.]
MSVEERCDRPAWASVGVVSRDDAVYRGWECEDCPAWSAQPFDAAHKRPWGETWLAER